ncbi:MAG: hypothetical protein LBI73_02160 [Myroides sp.]|nr:hypothetical protein [Myroides sp.]
MKKIFLFAAMAVMGLSTVSCSNSDDTTSNYKEAIKTSWVESKIQFLNKDKGFISEEVSDVTSECGVDYVTFTGKEYIKTSNYKSPSTNKCEVETDVYIYSMGSKFLTLTEKGEKKSEILSWEIVELTSNKLVIIDTDKVKFAKERGYPEGTVYIQKVYAKK